jgi:hypothetical protein
MLCQNNKIELRLAGPDDRDGIRRVFESGKFDGDFSIQFLRNPDPLTSMGHDGDRAVLIVMEYVDTLEIIAVAGCVIRREYVRSEIKRIGYLTGLKILPEYQRKVYCIADGYQFIRESTKDDVDFYYTTILSSNTGVVKLLEKKHRNMPTYLYLGDYTTYCIKAGGVSRVRLTGIVPEERESLYSEELPGLDFSPADTALFRLKDDDFYALRDSTGEILACCAIYDQQIDKQYVISAYKGIYKLLSKIPTGVFGYPRFPKAGNALNYASIAFLYVKDGSPEIGRRFIKAVAACAKRYDLLLSGLFVSSPKQAIFEKVKHVQFKSRLYEVAWDEPRYIQGNPIGLEVSLL